MELKNSGLYVIWIPFRIGVLGKGRKNFKSQLPIILISFKKTRKCQPISALAEKLCCELRAKKMHFLRIDCINHQSNCYICTIKRSYFLRNIISFFDKWDFDRCNVKLMSISDHLMQRSKFCLKAQPVTLVLKYIFRTYMN